MAIQIQLRRGTASQWTTANTLLAQGELGLETDTNKFKFGDGVTTWNSLAYYPTGTVTSVAATGGTGISITGSPITSSGTLNITNTAPDQTVALTAGTGISTSGTYPNFTITNSAPDQTVVLTAGTGISTSGTYPNFTVTNSAPDQTVSLTGAGTTSISGTYPNFTITSNDSATGTVTSVAATAGTGISITGSPITTSGTLNITNSAPDQTVVLTASTGISTSGTYPNFTITNSAPDQTVALTGAGTTSVTGTYPNFTITSNDSATGTVTSVGLSGGTTGLTVTGSPITTSGTITLGGTLDVDNGGTGQTSYTDGQLLIGNTTGNTLTKATLTAGSGIAITNGGGLISIAATNSGTVTSVTGTSPVASSGGATPAISLASGYGDTQNPYASKTANHVLAAPDGSAGVPTFRAIVAADIPTLNQNTTGSAATLTTGRTIAITGDLAYTSPSFNGSANVTAAGTLATVNANVGSFTNATLTVNGKGLITAASSGTAPVTSVTATSPVASTGGATPVISMPAATTTVSGYLTSTDWNTFNGKGSGTVTSVAATVPSFLAVTGSPITTSGTLAIALASTPTNGQLLIGNGTGFSYANLTAGSNITITNSSGGITIASSGGGGGSSPIPKLLSWSIGGF